MIDTYNLQEKVVSGLENYLSCTVEMSNQAEDIPKYPFVSYTITALANENNGTYGEYDDGKVRKPHIQTWSITVYSDDYDESFQLANKARTWLDYAGRSYLNLHNIIVQSVGQISDRTNVLTVGYQYAYGFDCFFWLFDEVENTIKQTGTIDEVSFDNVDIKKG